LRVAVSDNESMSVDVLWDKTLSRLSNSCSRLDSSCNLIWTKSSMKIRCVFSYIRLGRCRVKYDFRSSVELWYAVVSFRSPAFTKICARGGLASLPVQCIVSCCFRVLSLLMSGKWRGVSPYTVTVGFDSERIYLWHRKFPLLIIYRSIPQWRNLYCSICNLFPWKVYSRRDCFMYSNYKQSITC
jgi:hypothetical protein